jgi:hypothetical protein
VVVFPRLIRRDLIFNDVAKIHTIVVIIHRLARGSGALQDEASSSASWRAPRVSNPLVSVVVVSGVCHFLGKCSSTRFLHAPGAWDRTWCGVLPACSAAAFDGRAGTLPGRPAGRATNLAQFWVPDDVIGALSTWKVAIRTITNEHPSRVDHEPAWEYVLRQHCSENCVSAHQLPKLVGPRSRSPMCR